MCGEFEDADFTDSRYIVARVEHRCVACRNAIRPDDLYVRTAQGAEGSVQTFKHCLRCWQMLKAVTHHTGEGARFDLNCGEVWENPPEHIAALAFLTPDEAQRDLVPHTSDTWRDPWL
jgi:hypothetical protein